VEHLSLEAGVFHERSGAISPLPLHLRLALAYRLIPESVVGQVGDY
jgi:hypothetical protein